MAVFTEKIDITVPRGKRQSFTGIVAWLEEKAKRFREMDKRGVQLAPRSKDGTVFNLETENAEVAAEFKMKKAGVITTPVKKASS